MTLYEWLIAGCIAGLVLTSIVHSAAGEKLLIGPLLKYRGNKVLEHELGRMLLRFAWHITSVAWLVLAYILYVMVFTAVPLQSAILNSVGISFLAIGVFDLIATKGRHIGWPLLTLIGVFALLAQRFAIPV